MLIRQTKDSELKFARGGARHRAGLRSAGSAEAVLSGPHKSLCLYHNAFPRYYQLVPVEAVSHQKSPLKKKFPGFCPSERKLCPSETTPSVSSSTRRPGRSGQRDAHGAGACLHADGHVGYPVYPAVSGRRWAAESVYPAASGRRWAAQSEHGGFERVVP